MVNSVDKNKKQLFSGVTLSYIGQALQILVTLFYTPVILRFLGQSEYGIYQIAFSVVSYLSLFTFGFSSTYIKFYSEANKQDNSEEEIAQLNGMYLLVFAVLGGIVLIVGAFLAINTNYVLGGKLTESELATSQVLMWIMVVNSVIHFPLTVFNNYIIAKERFVCLQLLNLLGVILNPVMTFPLLLYGFKSISLAVALLGITIIKTIVSVFYCAKILIMKFAFRTMRFTLFRDIGTFSFFIFLETMISMINVSLDRFILGKMVGSISVAIYSVGGQINTLYTSLSTSISSVFTPKINRLVAENSKNSELSSLFIKIGRLQYSILLLVLLGFIIFGRRFICMWAGSGYERAYYVALVLIIPNTINLIQNIAIEVQRAKGLQKYRSMMYSIIAVLNILISIFLIMRYSEIGAAMGTAIAWIIGSGILMNWFYTTKVGLDIKLFWKEILFMSKTVVPFIVIGGLLQDVINSVPTWLYFGFVLSFVFLYSITEFFTGLHKNEKSVVYKKLKELFYGE